ncbi:polyphosphate polymerase domain-containing protein [Anaerosacchariphilus polymeriproducens]|uniref:VTC domain-containing protein n=1 Tax=Anaerosacchariphilus polymeriproducens TaxID=1812858 RepID=A0A371AY69_9FIRM|nr:polyphosphate polymerase domain-containing protein [Anaerosacchariphilus polymeriproducens]RDU24497.1 VTC domain-containing protein [Anaerosacchariphilus polymeriproducens]
MNAYQGTFKRYEKKYLLNDKQYFKLKEKTKNQLKIDNYGDITICNIYFDTPNRLLIRSSLEKPIYKEKLRLRSYGIPTLEDNVYIELKKKYKGVVYKRREQMDLASAEDYLYNYKPVKKETQITKEIDWFLKFYKNLEPSMYISYNRTAMYGTEDPELRLTFDSNILYREEDLYLESGIWGKPLLKERQRLMEIKIPGAMPIWLSYILSELEIYPTSFSKYGNGYKEMITKGEIKYA